ncbi:TIGR04222 domain-containing membrane protein [uncultured Sphaerotilus sp.]|uniref:TIGR04222 domain-containing membrane protein n=1 Tax=uncultured Sphaerotilus sp. TaxID=474984 RepID=UPI0030CA2669
MRLTDPAATALWSRLQAFKLNPPGLTRTISARLAEENGWTTEYTRRAVEEYRRFLFLTQVAGRPVSPSVAVDVVWHTHLLYSRDYWGRLCGEVLGGPLHHDPNPGGKQQNARHDDQYRDTLDDYLRVFGTAPPGDLWPTTVAAPAPASEILSDHHRMLTRLLAGGYRPSVLAFLSGGHGRVTDTALASLQQRELLSLAAGQPVLGSRVPRDDEGLTPEEWTVWRKLTGRGRSPKLPLGLVHHEVQQEAVNEGLWPTPEQQGKRWMVFWCKTGLMMMLAGLLFYWELAALVIWVPFGGFLVLRFTRAVIKPSQLGQYLVEELRHLVPQGTVAPDSPLAPLLVATGAISLKSLSVPAKSDGGGCGGGGCGGCGGGC